jgi:hypothetical protein
MVDVRDDRKIADVGLIHRKERRQGVPVNGFANRKL